MSIVEYIAEISLIITLSFSIRQQVKARRRFILDLELEASEQEQPIVMIQEERNSLFKNNYEDGGSFIKQQAFDTLDRSTMNCIQRNNPS